MCLENTTIVISKTNCDGIGNVLKGFISALSIHNDVVIECNHEYIYGKYDTILDKKYIYDHHIHQPHLNNKIKLQFYTCRLLVLLSEEDDQENIYNEFQYTNGCGNGELNRYFSFKKLIDWNYDSSKICDKIKSRIINVIKNIEFSPIIMENVNRFIEENNICENTVGVSVRTWKGCHENNINREYSFDVYRNKILGVLDENNFKNKIIFSFDNHNVENEYVNLCQQFGIKYITIKKPCNMNDLQYALYKIIILSKCRVCVANRISTFSELIFWFSECKIRMYPLF
jgi:hypothetical protein